MEVNRLERKLEAGLDSTLLIFGAAPCNCVSEYKVQGFIGGINLPDQLPPPYDPSIDNDVDAEALRRLWSKLREADHQFQGGVFLGELHQTIDMLLHPAKTLQKGIASYLNSVKKRVKRVRNPKNISKVIGDTWLEYSFGWKPLLADIDDAAHAAARIVQNIPQVRFHAYADGQSSSEVKSAPSALFIIFDKRSVTRRFYGLRYYGALSPMAEDTQGNIISSAIRVQKMAGFDLLSFVPTIWELVPWSFLIDYFANVGDLLNQMSTDTSKIKWLCRSRKRTSELSHICANDPAATQASWGSTKISVSGPTSISAAKNTQFIRETNFTIPLQEFRVRFDLRWKQVANIGALVSTGKLLSLSLTKRF